MALSKTISTNYGVNAEYHKIAQVNINWHVRDALVELHSFIDQSSRAAGAHPVAVHSFWWRDDEFPFQFETNNVQTAYNKIKTLPEWAESVDI